MSDIFDGNILLTENGILEASFFDELNRLYNWKTSNEAQHVHKYKSTRITDEEYSQLKDIIKGMRESEDYKDYKKSFDAFCRFIHIMSQGVILKKILLTKNPISHYTLYVEYSYNTKKITLPEGTMLYHMSKVDGIKELIPVFRGKQNKRSNNTGYLYDKARVYFTIRKNMPKFLADYKPNEKMYLYLCKKPIKQVYVDPLVWSSVQGAVYVETTTPIPVEQVDTSLINKLLKATGIKNDEINESVGFDIEGLFSFISENGLEICDDDKRSIFEDCEFI